ncbi:WAT1-related protein [Melia azedarach]|uniref:WAT1-related protein n=1 Tax=Melia azedarach TaxID=155640 RepID=A0ACC1Z0B1_MELAZ|nr:WAT1-related protein [Melia azedarach]
MKRNWKDAVLFTAMVAVECSIVGTNTIFKAATKKGMSNYVFVVYSFAVTTLVLFPLAFIFRSSTALPSVKFPLFSRICLLGLAGALCRIIGYTGIAYSGPTLASLISNITPAFTFILAIIFRMEKLTVRNSSTQAKIIGTIVSISGAMLVVLYTGPVILSSPSSSAASELSIQWSVGSPKSSWVIGGLLLTLENILVSILFIIQTQTIKIYPAEFVIAFLYSLCATIISAPLCLVAETNLSAWRLKPDIELAAIIFSGGFGISLCTVVHIFGVNMKGPVYTATFKPLSIAIAAFMSFIFLGDALHLGSVVGAVIISIGFYAVIWGKANEERANGNYSGITSLGASSDSKIKTPLLQSLKVESRDT